MGANVAITTSRLVEWTEIGLLPDNVIRHGIRRLLRGRLEDIDAFDCERVAQGRERFISMMDASEIAPVPDLANDQHYEVPAEFFRQVLGQRLKYSCGYWPAGVSSLDDAETAALTVTGARAQLADGQSVLDLGCGWGSFSLWGAERYPNSQFTAVSNSRGQREAIVAEAGSADRRSERSHKR